MGILTTLKGISPTAAEVAAASALGKDVVGLLTATESKAEELIVTLRGILNILPNGDSNITTINNLITSLS